MAKELEQDRTGWDHTQYTVTTTRAPAETTLLIVMSYFLKSPFSKILYDFFKDQLMLKSFSKCVNFDSIKFNIKMDYGVGMPSDSVFGNSRSYRCSISDQVCIKHIFD